MALIFSYRYDKQPYVSWKGDIAHNQFNLAVPTNKRPAINGPAPENGDMVYVNKGRAQPIKHWRKQLDPGGQSGRGKVSVGSLIDRPGGSTRLAADADSCKTCDASRNSLYAKEYIQTNTLYFPKPSPSDTVDSSNNPQCLACNPEAHVIKSASTIINKNYYSDTNGYLKSRCKTYEQKQSFTKKSGINYGTSSDPAHPTDETNGPQVFNMLNCATKCVTNPAGTQTTIYKPNNQQFSQQGAVSSGSRLAKLKYDTITKNGNSFRSAYGQQGANAGKYSSNDGAPYFQKNKIQACARFNINGHKTICTK